jgi:hypothetical protein
MGMQEQLEGQRAPRGGPERRELSTRAEGLWTAAERDRYLAAVLHERRDRRAVTVQAAVMISTKAGRTSPAQMPQPTSDGRVVPSWTVSVHTVRRLSHVTATGTVRYRDLAHAQQALADTPGFSPTSPLLIDLRDAAEVFLTREEMQDLITLSPLATSTRRAILVSRPAVGAVARAYEKLREHHLANDVVRTCRSLNECGDWLGIDLDMF